MLSAPRRIAKFDASTVAGSSGSEKVTVTDAPLSAVTESAPSAGSLATTAGRSASTRKALVESTGTSTLPFRSVRPATEMVAAPDGIPSVIVSSPVHVSPVNCRGSTSKPWSATVAVTVGLIAASIPAWASANPMFSVSVWPSPNSDRFKAREVRLGDCVSTMKLLCVDHGEATPPASMVCTDQK